LSVVGAGTDRLVFVEQDFVLAQRGPELGDLRLVFVVDRAQLGRVGHVVQVVDDAPGAAQALGRFLERDHEVIPGDLVGRRFEPGDHRGGLLDQLLDGRGDVFRAEQVETRQAGKIEEGIAGVRFHSVPS
jgi:hypothetical protein